jgi:hypothetical protein
MDYTVFIGAERFRRHTTPPTMKALYVDDTITTCECCGKTNLKATVAMQLDCGGILYYGRTCAARNSGKTSQKVTKEIRSELQLAHGRTMNHLSDLRRSGVKLTRQIMREVAQSYRADVDCLLRNWGHWAEA